MQPGLAAGCRATVPYPTRLLVNLTRCSGTGRELVGVVSIGEGRASVGWVARSPGDPRRDLGVEL